MGVFDYLRSRLPLNRRIPVLGGVTVDQALLRAQNAAADLRARMVRNKWLQRRRPTASSSGVRRSARQWEPALSEAEHVRLQRRLQVLQMRWAEEERLRSAQEAKRDKERADKGEEEDKKDSQHGKVIVCLS